MKNTQTTPEAGTVTWFEGADFSSVAAFEASFARLIAREMKGARRAVPPLKGKSIKGFKLTLQ